MKDDWYLTVQNDLKDLNINNEDEVKNIPKYKFKKFMKKKIVMGAFNYLQEKGKGFLKVVKSNTLN